MRDPVIIQGGMGVGVSGWRLAAAVSRAGQLGVVSGTALAVTLARQLAVGDVDGHVRRALSQFPVPGIAQRVCDRYLATAGSRPGDRFRAVPRPTLTPGAALTELTVVANFVEVFLAKEGHVGPIGINYLEKIQLPTLPSLYGAMLAGVDVVLMGAGVPARIPAALDALAEGRPASLPVEVAGAASGERHVIGFDPQQVAGDHAPPLTRPRFLAIVASATLARFLARAASGGPDGFVVETPVAGGHNAPPRDRSARDGDGQPVYGPRDQLDLDAIAALGLPFWLAGGYATPERLVEAQAAGAVGVQVGTAFAFCDESGLAEPLKRQLLARAATGRATVRTDPVASPTGFPFKVVELDDTLADPEVARRRPRRCDLGYLRELYRRPDGRVGYRCPAEPVDDYVRKGGDVAATTDRLCLCNGLVATVGLGQFRHDGYAEPSLITAGDDLAALTRFLADGADRYSARDVIDHLLGVAPAPAAATPE